MIPTRLHKFRSRLCQVRPALPRGCQMSSTQIKINPHSYKPTRVNAHHTDPMPLFMQYLVPLDSTQVTSDSTRLGKVESSLVPCIRSKSTLNNTSADCWTSPLLRSMDHGLSSLYIWSPLSKYPDPQPAGPPSKPCVPSSPSESSLLGLSSPCVRARLLGSTRKMNRRPRGPRRHPLPEGISKLPVAQPVPRP